MPLQPISSCSFTGHRPQRFSFGFDEDDEKCLQLKHVLAQQIHLMPALGITTFYTGMALGVDQWAAEIVIGLKLQWPDVKLIAVLPCETQANKWSLGQRERYFNTLPKCDEVITLQTKYTPDCMHKRNRWLIDNAEYLLAVYDGGAKGGAAYTVKYAREKGRKITVIHPDTLAVTSFADFEAMMRRKEVRIIEGGGDR